MIYRYRENAEKNIVQKNYYHLKKKKQELAKNSIRGLNVVHLDNEGSELESVAVLSEN